MQQFNQLTSVNFQGTVITFGRTNDGSKSICYNVLGQQQDENDNPTLEWTGFTTLEFTSQVRQVGMSIITLAVDAATMRPSDAPFRVITDQKYITVVQQSVLGTLYINRFTLQKSKSGSGNSPTTYTLSPAWEVRFSRSENEDVPEDSSDAPDYLDPDGDPFLEPSLELSMVDDVKDGMFDVLLLPVSGTDKFNWQFVTLNDDKNALNFFNFPATDTGLFNVSGKTVTDSYQIEPDNVVSLNTPGTDTALVAAFAPRLALYTKHEKIVQPDGTSIGVKRAARVMLTQPVTVADGTQTATIDSAVGAAGTLANFEATLDPTNIVPAVFDLYFNGVSYIDLLAPSDGDNPLAITGPYKMDFMIQPSGLSDNVLIIGGSDQSTPASLAPYVKQVAGDKIEIGFGNGTDQVSCQTLQQILTKDIWSLISVEYKGAGGEGNPFVVTVNDSVVPLTACSTDAEPSGTAVDRIGNATNGFIGALNEVKITVGGTDAVNLPCNSVDYTVDPPVTPNSAASGITAEVFGPKAEPSNSPVDADMSGTFYIDANGVTYYVALADFISPQSEACLIEGSDALLHYYFQGENDDLSVTQFATDSARATFSTEWTTKWGSGDEAVMFAKTSTDRHFGHATSDLYTLAPRLFTTGEADEQVGTMNFVAHRIGTYMNTTQISVAPSPTSPLLCDVTVTGPDTVGTETWTGLPRDIERLSQIWNGSGASNPDAQGVQDGSSPYFNYGGDVPSVIAVSSSESSYFQFTTPPYTQLVLSEVAVASGSTDEFVNLTVAVAAPSNWSNGTKIQQVWPEVPADPNSIKDVLVGKKSHYDYGAVTTPGTRAYGIPASTARSDDQVSYVTFFVQDALKDFAIKVSNAGKASLCTVDICGQTLTKVPRDQAAFAEIINGESGSYNYPDDYLTTVAPFVFANTNGLTATVQNVTPPNLEADAMAYSGLFRLIFEGSDYDSGVMVPISKTAASPLQKAVFTANGTDTPISGSLLFAAVVVTPPTNGGKGRLENTSMYSDDIAPLLIPGVNGGWTAQPEEFSLSLNGDGKTNWVEFNVAKDNIVSDKLAQSGDMTLASWMFNAEGKNTETVRSLTYNVTGNIENPELPMQYAIGSRIGAGLVMGASSFAQSAFNFDPPALTVQIYIKPGDNEGVVWNVSEIRGGTQYAKLSIDQYGKVVFDFLSGAGTVSSANALASSSYTCVTATISDAGEGKVALALYLDDQAPATAEATNSFTGALGNFMIGNNTGGAATATLNGAAFWQRALTAQEVADSFNYGFPNTSELLGIRWNLAEGTGTTLQNAAATGSEYNAELINPANPSWATKGAFNVPYVGRNDMVISSNHILKGWTNVALASQQGHALKLNGAEFGEVTDGSPFNPGSSFAIEAWILPSKLNAKQVIVDKPGSYSLYVDTLGQVCLTVKAKQDGATYDAPPIIFDYAISSSLKANTPSYVAVNFTTGTVNQDEGTQDYLYQNYFVKASLFINGVKVETKNKEDYTKPVSIDTDTSSFFLGIDADKSFGFDGLISQVRLWGRTLNEDEIQTVFDLHYPPVDRNGLIAGWDFNDGSGKIAKGIDDNNNLPLSSNQLWTIWQDVARAKVYVNGQDSIPLRLTVDDIGGYGEEPKFTLGGNMVQAGLSSRYVGQLDDIRLYSNMQTAQQISESMSKGLVGSEPNLAGYWAANAGSGAVLYDQTGNGNNGALKPTGTNAPKWSTDSAPIQNESRFVVNALGGEADYFVAQISGQPSVVEYAAVETDAYGNNYSVLLRGYFYLSEHGITTLQTGYKVGDLDMVYVGQVQSAPSVVGFIEGGPPLPSENQTLAYWYGDDGGPARLYSTTSSVVYQETQNKTWSFSASQSGAFTSEFNIKGGLYQKSKAQVEAGLGAEAAAQVVETEINYGAKFKLGGDIGSTDAVSQSHSSGTSLSSSLTPAGTWEPENNILNPTVGRRYIQNNLGIAIVKSATADLYMQAIKGTQTPVGYVMVPNKTIPVDTNIIDFPINPKYVKNGTLDGKVGLENDPDYPQANEERGSYFKPVEAYDLKQKIEQEEQQIKAFYDQFDRVRYSVIGSLGAVKDKLKENAAFDFDNNVNQRSIYNNYVWTAGGGLHREEHTIANSYSETYTGASSLKFAIGGEVKAKVGTPAGGYYIESDLMLGGTFSMTATKTESTSNGFSLACSVAPTDFLNPPIIEEDENGKLLFKGYGDTPAPGKVDGYRYMAFLLSPAEANFNALMNEVIDKNWLNNSTSAAADAMRQATAAENGSWRVLYRTTYVSRVPAPFQAVKDNTDAPNISPPANLQSNSWIVSILSELLTMDAPTPVEIGAAIDQVLGSPPAGPGLLKDIIPWWSDFYGSAQVYGSEQFKELAELRSDLLSYMINKYEAEKYLELDNF